MTFREIYQDLEKLEAIFNTKALIDASFAYICDRDDAGRMVGGNYANAYLKERLGLSPGEAFDRIARGRDLFAPVPETEPTPDPGPDDDVAEDLFGSTGHGEADASDRSARDAAAAAEREAARQAAEEERRQAQADARSAAGNVSAEKQAIIRRELDKLLKPARSERQRLHALALKEAANRDPKDLRLFVRRLVEEENRKHAPRENPNAGHENRSVHVGRRNADGTVDIKVTTTAGHAALIKAHLDKGLVPNSNMPDGESDTRTPMQRYYDQFFAIFSKYEESQQAANGGAASVVLAMTVDDLADADAATLFDSNTGIELDCFDLVRLGLDGTTDYILQLDSVTGVPLSLGRTRCASIPQRIAMLAIQGVCSWVGCTAPLTECEAHHILAWIKGGLTDMSNITGLCREHHRCNNDERDGSWGKGHMEYDPGTGRAGLVRAGTNFKVFNESDPAEHSAANRLRKRESTRGTPLRSPRSPGPDPAIFPPRPRRRTPAGMK